MPNDKQKTKNDKRMNPLVGIIMGSDSDLTVMQAAPDLLK